MSSCDADRSERVNDFCLCFLFTQQLKPPGCRIETVGRFHSVERFVGCGRLKAWAQKWMCLSARTLPPKAPQSSSEWPPEVSSPLLSFQEANFPTATSRFKKAATQRTQEAFLFFPHQNRSISQTLSFSPIEIPSLGCRVRVSFPASHLHSALSACAASPHVTKLRFHQPLPIRQTRWLPSRLPITMSTRRRST